MNLYIEEDPIYGKIYRELGYQAAVDCGWFEELHPRKHIAPSVDKIKINIPTQWNSAVLIYPGAFAPVHAGHIANAKSAIARLEKAGYSVVACHFIPDHDSYVSSKCSDWGIYRRLKHLSAVMSEHSTFCLDHVPAIYDSCSRNVSKHILRIQQKYTEAFGIRPEGCKTTFWLTGGSDNTWLTQLAQCPVVDVNAVVIGRDKPLEAEETGRLLTDTTYIGISSTSLRPSLAPEKILDRLHYRTSGLDPDGYVLSALEEAFGGQVTTHRVQADTLKLEGIRHQSCRPVISIDKLQKTKPFFGVNRVYEIGGMVYQKHDLNTAYADLKPGVYDLYDDDIATGQTIEKTIEYLRRHKIDIANVYTSQPKRPNTEILDEHDFIIQKPSNFAEGHSGLVIQYHPLMTIRCPYVWPFVNPVQRASIPQEQAITFSIKVWRANATYWKERPKYIMNNIYKPYECKFLNAYLQEPVWKWCERQADILEKYK